MLGVRRSTAAAALVLLLAGSRTAIGDHDSGDTIQLGGFFGVRVFSSVSSLGTPTSSSLASSVLFGARATYRLRPWARAEAELPLVITGSRDDEATVLFAEPRAHLLVERRLRSWLRPFAVAGAGAPFTLSSNRPRLASDIQPAWYLGAGVKLDRERGFSVRVDLRVPVLPERGDGLLAPELELMVSLYRYERQRPGEPVVLEVVDSDADGLDDERDGCLQRAEDVDGFEDDDGCPDIDDDRDEVLDIADKCPRQPEDWNGYRDDDGCPDVVPPEVTAFSGVIDGVQFRPGSAVMTRASHRVLDRLAQVLSDYPSIRGRIIGHTDASGDSEANLDLSQRRAQAVKAYLVARGVAEHRLAAVGVGDGAPIADNDSERGRARNRRVEFQIRRRQWR